MNNQSWNAEVFNDDDPPSCVVNLGDSFCFKLPRSIKHKHHPELSGSHQCNNSIGCLSSTTNDLYDNSSLKFELLQKNESEEFQNIFETRQKLAVIHQCRNILKAVREHQVVLLVGSSGCGKTTQISQMLLDDYIFNNCGTECRIACIQTRRDRAISAAERVSYERVESLGNSVGFCVGRKKVYPRDGGSILYCTCHFILKKCETDPMLTNITAFILDDIQDKCAEYNQLMEHLQNILPYRPDLKVILLSTTASEDTFCKYFKNYHVLYVHDTSYPTIKKTHSISTLNESFRDAEWDIRTISSEGESSTSEDSAKRVGRNYPIPTANIKRRRLSSISCHANLQVAIIDRLDPHGRINDDRWLRLEKKLLTEMVSDKWSNEGISFDGANWSRGVKLVHCSNSKSLDFLKATIASVGKFWPGAQLEVVPRSDLPLRTFARMWIPPPVTSTKSILALIEKQNDGLNTKGWQIIGGSLSKKNAGKDFRLFIDGNSLKNIRECQGRIKFGLNFIRIRIEENKSKK